MATEISCEVHRIVFPKWSSVSDDRKEAIGEILQNDYFVEEHPDRKGFVSLTKIEDVIAGFYAHEGERQSWQYDDMNQISIQRNIEFEHIFFALFFHGTDYSNVAYMAHIGGFFAGFGTAAVLYLSGTSRLGEEMEKSGGIPHWTDWHLSNLLLTT